MLLKGLSERCLLESPFNRRQVQPREAGLNGCARANPKVRSIKAKKVGLSTDLPSIRPQS
jgi:hypothetical protein